MMLAVRSTWKAARQLPRISEQLSSYPIHERIAACIAIDQCMHRPEFGKHEISKRKILFANDNKELFFGRTLMGLYTISWIAHHFLEIPLIIDVSTQTHANINIRRFLRTNRLPRMIPFAIE
jgi:hypothetical protein